MKKYQNQSLTGSPQVVVEAFWYYYNRGQQIKEKNQDSRVTWGNAGR